MISKITKNIKKIKMVLTPRQRSLFWIILILALISACLETVSVSAILPLVKVLITPEKMFEYGILQPAIVLFSIDTDMEMIIFVLLGVIVLYLLKNIYLIFFSWVKAKYASKVQRECSVQMMKGYMDRGYTYFLDKNPNDIVQGVVGDVQALYNIINSIVYVFTKLLIVAMIGIFMFIADWMLASALMVASVICLFVLILGFKNPMKKTGVLLREYTISANKVLYQAIYGIKEVMVMRKQKRFIDQYQDNMYLRQQEDIKRSVATDAPNAIVEAFCITTIMIILGVRVLMYTDSSEFVAVMASFAVGAFRILPAIGYLSSSYNTILTSLPSLDVIYENLILVKDSNLDFNKVEITDDPEYAGHIFEDKIELKNIEFSYNEKLGNVLENLNLEIKKNESIAIIGESGAGKSTLSDIILGILNVQKGNIYIDNIDVNKIPITWSSIIGFVPQAIYLCDATISENIAFGDFGNNIDRDKVRKVLKMAHLDEFIDSLPDGIDTVVGERGVRLSGGQRQRIGIARALYNSPQILLLDEATSALDNDTERSVMEAIESLQGNITMIIIAHRLSTVKNCNHIYEIKNGVAVERKYEDLMV